MRRINAESVLVSMIDKDISVNDIISKLGISKSLFKSWVKGTKFPSGDKLITLALILRLKYNKLVISYKANDDIIVEKRYFY